MGCGSSAGATNVEAVKATVAVCVMIQHINTPTDEIEGGKLGGPIAKAVMEAVLNPRG